MNSQLSGTWIRMENCGWTEKAKLPQTTINSGNVSKSIVTASCIYTLCKSDICWCLIRTSFDGKARRHRRHASLFQSISSSTDMGVLLLSDSAGVNCNDNANKTPSIYSLSPNSIEKYHYLDFVKTCRLLPNWLDGHTHFSHTAYSGLSMPCKSS